MACSPKTKSILTYNALCFCPAVFLLSVVFTNAWLENGENGVGLLGIGQPLYRDFKWRGLPEYSYHKLPDVATLVLAVIATACLVFSAVTGFVAVYCHHLFTDACDRSSRCYRINSRVFYIGVGSYILSSVLGIAACIRFGSVYPMTSLGQSWFCVLVTSLFTALAVCTFLCDTLWKDKRVGYLCGTLLFGIYWSPEIDIVEY